MTMKHVSVGTALSQSEYEQVDGHVLNSQAQGDLIRAITATSLTRLAIGAANTVLITDGTDPSWAASPTLTDLTLTNDLLLASASIINFDSGDVTITHSAGVLTYGGDGAVVLTYGANVDLSFTGTTGTNEIILTNALADALSITDGSADILVIDTSTAGNLATWTARVIATSFTGILGSTGAAAITGTTIDATTDFTVGATVITDGVITDATGILFAAALDFNNENMTNVDIDSGAIDGTTIGAASASTGVFSTITGTTITATTAVLLGDNDELRLGADADVLIDYSTDDGDRIKVEMGTADTDWVFNWNVAAAPILRMRNAEATGGVLLRLIGGDLDAGISFQIDDAAGWTIGADDSNGDAFVIAQSDALGTNDAFRVTEATPPVITYNTTHPVGTFDYVCEVCGDHAADPFVCHGENAVWHDDVMDFRMVVAGSGEEREMAIDYFAKVGVMERTTDNDGNPEVFTVLGPDWQFAGAMAYQNRQRIDSEVARLEAKVDKLERRLAS